MAIGDILTIPEIGAIRDRLKDILGEEGMGRLEEAIDGGDIDEVMRLVARVHLASGITAAALEDALFGGIPMDDPTFLDRLAEGALSYGEAAALRSQLAAAVPLVVARAYPGLVVDASIANGHEVGAREAAEAADPMLAYKSWVRVYPRKVHRDWHDDLAGGPPIPSDEPFVLSGGPNAGAEVMGPHDWESLDDPEEWMNCGHATIYVPDPTWGETLRALPPLED
jgi:hypothetical protein